ncbi:MAG: restriction endonuclease subunit R [Candidatus Competibacteraceae bacterium]|nr:MAG: restriction endonuclease subunit R [Candidatus Competibacteraceae bacterium]
MADLIENPIINSPFEEPKRHFRFDDNGITDEIVPGRRRSTYFIPIAQPKLKAVQKVLDLAIQHRAEENKLINDLRERVAYWRQAGRPYTTATTRRLLEYWTRPDRERRLFFCQIEAVETLIYLTEIAPKQDANYGTSTLERFKQANAGATPDSHAPLPRYAAKMATGSGKTVVMGMLMAWQALNKLANRQDQRFSDAFLIVSPGITIRDRLRVLLPNDPNNYYRQLDLLPPSLLEELSKAKVAIINYHAFIRRERNSAASLTKKLLRTPSEASPFQESAGQMVVRVCAELGNKKQIVVLNDEAHHCYHRRPLDGDEKLSGDDLQEAKQREEEAKIWVSGLGAVQKKLGIRAVYDLSATPFFLRGSGYDEGTLFPWVTSDFSLTDAIESGIVKVPRVPVADNTDQSENPTYRNLWPHIKQDMPKGRGSKDEQQKEPVLPKELQGALHSLYSHYEKAYQQWQVQVQEYPALMPPVFIVVCNNTRSSKLVFDYLAGWEKPLPIVDPATGQGFVLVPGALPVFSNVENGHWSIRPNTLLIDSLQLESGEALTEEFQAVAAREIEEFKDELRARYPGRNADDVTAEDLLREVMNTVGKRNKLGENIKCVVSVSMLTEGWDANTVTHVLGVRAFTTQLLCEQVVGRALRRVSYELEVHTIIVNGQPVTFEAFPVEYAEVYGVPFEFIPTAGVGKPQKQRNTTHVCTIEARQDALMTFPRLSGYRYALASETLQVAFTPACGLTLTTRQIPTVVENAPIVGESTIHRLDDLKQRRLNEVAFLLAKLVLEKYFRQEINTEYAIGGPVVNDAKAWLLPQVLRIAKCWLAECLTLKDETFPQLLLLVELAHDAADRIYQAIVAADSGASTLKPILQPYNTVGDTCGVSFNTSRETYPTNFKSHISHVVLDSGWEGKMAQALEYMDEVHSYVKNHNLDFKIPYTFEGQAHHYLPDFIVRIDDGCGKADLLNLIIEVSGPPLPAKAAKTATIQNLWVPAVNHSGQFGRWAFVEVNDPYSAMQTVREFLGARPQG